MNVVMLLAAIAAAELLVILALIWALHRAHVAHVRSIDRLLLLGKSSTPGEAIAAYERLNRIEAIRGASEELVAQRARVRGADQPPVDDVARNGERSSRWFLRRRPKTTTPPPSGG